MPKTGQICQQSGIYRSDCKDKIQIALSVGERFPPCRNCTEAVNWTLVRATEN